MTITVKRNKVARLFSSIERMLEEAESVIECIDQDVTDLEDVLKVETPNDYEEEEFEFGELEDVDVALEKLQSLKESFEMLVDFGERGRGRAEMLLDELDKVAEKRFGAD